MNNKFINCGYLILQKFNDESKTDIEKKYKGVDRNYFCSSSVYEYDEEFNRVFDIPLKKMEIHENIFDFIEDYFNAKDVFNDIKERSDDWDLLYCKVGIEVLKFIEKEIISIKNPSLNEDFILYKKAYNTLLRNKDNKIPESFIKIGYDVAYFDSGFYSAVYQELLPNGRLSREKDWEYFLKNLNEYMLFTDYNIAVDFCEKYTNWQEREYGNFIIYELYSVN